MGNAPRRIILSVISNNASHDISASHVIPLLHMTFPLQITFLLHMTFPPHMTFLLHMSFPLYMSFLLHMTFPLYMSFLPHMSFPLYMYVIPASHVIPACRESHRTIRPIPDEPE